MAKQALLSVLQKTMGKYVDGLDAKSLNLGLWSGKVALSNKLSLIVPNLHYVQVSLSDLTLKPEAVDSLHLPLQVRLCAFQMLLFPEINNVLVLMGPGDG